MVSPRRTRAGGKRPSSAATSPNRRVTRKTGAVKYTEPSSLISTSPTSTRAGTYNSRGTSIAHTSPWHQHNTLRRHMVEAVPRNTTRTAAWVPPPPSTRTSRTSQRKVTVKRAPPQAKALSVITAHDIVRFVRNGHAHKISAREPATEVSVTWSRPPSHANVNKLKHDLEHTTGKRSPVRFTGTPYITGGGNPPARNMRALLAAAANLRARTAAASGSALRTASPRQYAHGRVGESIVGPVLKRPRQKTPPKMAARPSPLLSRAPSAERRSPGKSLTLPNSATAVKKAALAARNAQLFSTMYGGSPTTAAASFHQEAARLAVKLSNAELMRKLAVARAQKQRLGNTNVRATYHVRLLREAQVLQASAGLA